MRLRHATLLAAGLLAAAARDARAQAPAGAAKPAVNRPSSMGVAPDVAGADTALSMATMAPGWHLTGGATGAAFFDPTARQDGRFALGATVFVFSREPGAGVGLVVGGEPRRQTLASYTAFVVGGDGRFRVVRREGDALRDLVPWTAHTAVAKVPAGQPNAKQELRVEADERVVRFHVNGAVVSELPRADVRPDGVFGFRVEPRANAHAATLVLGGQNIAPAAPPAAAKP